MPVDGFIPIFDDGGTGGGGGAEALVRTGAKRRRINFGFDLGRPGTEAEFDPSSFGTQAAIRAYSTALRSPWGVSGTNMTAALVTAATGGGITLTTAGASGDQAILTPLTINLVRMNALGWTTWSPASALLFRALLTTGASIADMRLLVGMTLIPNAADHDAGETPTDNDLVLLAYDTSHGSTSTAWHMVGRNNGGTLENSPVTSFKSVSTVRASTQYLIEIAVNGDNVPVFWINGQEVGQLSALKTGSVALLPFFAMQDLGGAAKAITLEDGDVSITI
jgi:hypothetical protein